LHSRRRSAADREVERRARSASSKKLSPSMTSPGRNPSVAALRPINGGGAAGGGPKGLRMSADVAGTPAVTPTVDRVRTTVRHSAPARSPTLRREGQQQLRP
jgi:hypothetical protein